MRSVVGAIELNVSTSCSEVKMNWLTPIFWSSSWTLSVAKCSEPFAVSIVPFATQNTLLSGASVIFV
jgi:hypothetical protein